MVSLDPAPEESRFKIPRKLRTFVREDELWLVALAGFVGVGSGAAVAGMVSLLHWMQHALFQMTAHDVSGATYLDPWRAAAVPVIGGLLLGALLFLASRSTRISIIDPIEANALHGGRIPIFGSLLLIVQTLISSGFGASLGMEAGYTQFGSAGASKLGQIFNVRRNDMRTLVGCGAAGAIAAAFDAPLTGAFYAFELIIATYAIGTLAPVVVASIAAVGTMRLFITPSSFEIGFAGDLALRDYALVALMGFLCALVGISLMKAASLAETAFSRTRLPGWARPTIGGIIVGSLALITPKVLSSGHAALQVGFNADYTAGFLLLLIVLKVLASAVSIGSGFRGGLFFASLFLGAMLGKLVAIIWMLAFGLTIPTLVFGIVGMCAMATAVLGAPLTMAFLALETTGSLPLTIAVLAAAVISSITVRRLFGYSFATWRFHLRGESIRSAADVGWIRELTVARMMRRDVRKAGLGSSLEHLKREFPLGSTQRVVIVDESGAYQGILSISDLHRVAGEEKALTELLQMPTTALLPNMNVREAMNAFTAAESDELVVVAGVTDKRVVGLLTEQHALRRYTEETDKRNG